MKKILFVTLLIVGSVQAMEILTFNQINQKYQALLHQCIDEHSEKGTDSTLCSDSARNAVFADLSNQMALQSQVWEGLVSRLEAEKQITGAKCDVKVTEARAERDIEAAKRKDVLEQLNQIVRDQLK